MADDQQKETEVTEAEDAQEVTAEAATEAAEATEETTETSEETTAEASEEAPAAEDTSEEEAPAEPVAEETKEEPVAEETTEEPVVDPVDEPAAEAVVEEARKIVGYTGEIEGEVIKLEDLDGVKDDDDAPDYGQLMQMIDDTLTNVSENEIVEGKIVSIGEKDIVIDIGFKSDGIVSKNEFSDELTPGDVVEVSPSGVAINGHVYPDSEVFLEDDAGPVFRRCQSESMMPGVGCLCQ